VNIRKIINIMSIELDGGLLANIFPDIVYSLIFSAMWIRTKDLEVRSLWIGMAVSLIFTYSFIKIFKMVIPKNNKIDKAVEQIVAILPVNKKERILGRLFNSGLILYMMIIPYIIMYIFTPSISQGVGVRGGLTLLIVYIVVWSTIRNISKYNKKYKIVSRILGIIFVALFLLNYSACMVDSWRDIRMYLYSNKISMIIGNTNVGILLGIATLIMFYYFNFIYVTKGIKNNRWQIQ